MPIAILIVGLIATYVSEKKEDVDDTEKIGQFVYLDSEGILHSRSKCISGMRITDKNGNSRYKSVEYIDIATLDRSYLKKLCSWCIDDEIYQQLCDIVEGHEDHKIINYVPGMER